MVSTELSAAFFCLWSTSNFTHTLQPIASIFSHVKLIKVMYLFLSLKSKTVHWNKRLIGLSQVKHKIFWRMLLFQLESEITTRIWNILANEICNLSCGLIGKTISSEMKICQVKLWDKIDKFADQSFISGVNSRLIISIGMSSWTYFETACFKFDNLDASFWDNHWFVRSRVGSLRAFFNLPLFSSSFCLYWKINNYFLITWSISFSLFASIINMYLFNNLHFFVISSN